MPALFFSGTRAGLRRFLLVLVMGGSHLRLFSGAEMYPHVFIPNFIENITVKIPYTGKAVTILC
jgi:hypothetical protein